MKNAIEELQAQQNLRRVNQMGPTIQEELNTLARHLRWLGKDDDANLLLSILTNLEGIGVSFMSDFKNIGVNDGKTTTR